MKKNVSAQFINKIPYFIWWKDLDGKFLGCNNNFLEYTGLKNEIDIVGKTDYDFWDKIEADFFRKIDNEIIASGKPQLDFDEQLTLPKLGRRWLSTSKIPMYDEDNKIIGSIGWFTDITSRKDLEAQLLRAKEEKYKMLFDSMQDMVQTIELIYNEQGEPEDYYIREINYAAVKFLGKTKEELINKRLLDFKYYIEPYWLSTFAQVQKTGKPTTYENYAVQFNKYFMVTAWRINEKYIGISAKDITEQKQINKDQLEANLKLENTEKELNEVQKIAKIGSWIFHIATQESNWSDEMYNIWEFDSKNHPAYDMIVSKIKKEDFAIYHSAITEAKKHGTAYDIEFRIYDSMFELKTIRSICHPVRDESGAIIKLAGTNQDISAQKLFEKAQAKNQRLKAVGEMSSSIAHDFNNSLQEMMGNLEIVKQQNGLSSTSIERLNNITSIIGDVAQRVSALQKFGDIKQDSSQSNPVNLNSLIEESLNQSRPLWKDTVEKEGLTVTVITNFVDIPMINCNGGELKSVIYNLIKNCIEAMPSGGEISIKTGVKNKKVYATFTDTGIGMTEDAKLNVFQPFYTTKGYELGRGLGMSGAYTTVQKYGGEIHIQSSELNKGTTFEIAFPISEPNEVIYEKDSVPHDKKYFKILWVDDDNLITETVNELVNSFGHKCDIANSGQEALDFIQRNHYDIIFTDIGMPGMNGWELADATRKKMGSEIKIVVVSGWDITEADKKKHTIDAVLQKPFLLEDLEQILQMV